MWTSNRFLQKRENVTLGDEGGHHEGRQGGAVGKVLSK